VLPRVHAIVLPSEASEFADDLRRIFLELSRSAGVGALTGECSPALDVYETDDSVEIAVDLPGVDPVVVRVVTKGSSVLIVGEKTPRRGQGDSSFHLVERGYGRFARVVRLTSACETSQARATLGTGELRVSIPKIKDRRGRALTIPIASEHPIA
jgi:HSP20 family protein